MATFRLFNIVEDRLETFPLDNHPPYLATSHVWRENVFDGDFKDSFGGLGIAVVVQQRHSHIRYCWFDTKCIDQNDEQDKLEQIPLMDRIYGEAECVVVYLTTKLNANQSQVDWLTQKINGALAMCQAEAWQEEGAYWKYGEGRQWLGIAMKALIRLASTAWATRVWTLQEYVLARKVIWIGQDLQPIEVDDYLFSALPDICDTLVLDELLTKDFRALNDNFVGTANARLESIDRTRIMELSVTRQATVSVDEIYGAMAASGVIIKPQLAETKAEVWSRWCEEAVRQGHTRWILLPASSGALTVGERETCVFPYLAQRHALSSSSGLDTVVPVGPVSVSDGTVSAFAHWAGTGRLTRRLGSVHEPQTGRIHRDITLILFAEARWSLALKLIWTFGGGRYNAKQTQAIAQVLVQSYARAGETVSRGREDMFRPFISSHFQQYVWNDFMELQQGMMMGVNNGVAYLCEICIGGATELSFDAVVVLGRSPTRRRFELLDFVAGPDRNNVLMAVENATLPDQSTVFHKVGMTIGVSEDVAQLWRSIPPKEFKIGGYGCSGCGAHHTATKQPINVKSASTHNATGRQLGMLDRHENRIRMKLFSTNQLFSNSPLEARRRQFQARRCRHRLSSLRGVRSKA